jgi:hypothetical protein
VTPLASGTRGIALAAALFLLVAVSCGGSSGEDEAAAGDGGTSTQASPEPATELTITFWPAGRDGKSIEATLTCDPAGGTHTDAEAACAALAADREALAPVAPDVACTMIFGGPEQATVVGVLDGQHVDAAFERSNGCELDRWDRMAALLQLGD